MVSSSKFHFGRAILGGNLPPEDPQIWSKQLSHKELPTLWVSTFYIEKFKNLTSEEPFWERFAPRGSSNLVQTIVSQTISYIMSFNFLCWAVQKFHFGGEGCLLLGGPPNFVQTIVSQTTSYIINFNFLCSAFQKFHFENSILGVCFLPREHRKFGPRNKKIFT